VCVCVYTYVVFILVYSMYPLQAPPIRLADGSGRNGIITNYSVVYQLDGSLNSSVMVTTNSNSTSLVLHDLTHSSTYHVMVAANTKAGTGPYTTAVIGKTLRLGNYCITVISQNQRSFHRIS